MAVGDVNSTLAAAPAAAKLGVPVVHLEAWLRTRYRQMPEGINRILTDQLSDICLTPSRDADQNLLAEGIGKERISFVGNVMIDTLDAILPSIEGTMPTGMDDLQPGRYTVVTLQCPSNVDFPDQLVEILSALAAVSETSPVVFPIHPRTRKRLDDFGLVADRLRYQDMLRLQAGAGLVITDSGGLQEEVTVPGVHWLTMRTTTERPITISEGTNTLVSSIKRDNPRGIRSSMNPTQTDCKARGKGWPSRISCG